jgi:hypothetical protein
VPWRGGGLASRRVFVSLALVLTFMNAAAASPAAAQGIGTAPDCTGRGACLPTGLLPYTLTSYGKGCTFVATVNWGDGTQNVFRYSSPKTVTTQHQFTTPGIYTVTLNGTASGHDCTYTGNSEVYEVPASFSSEGSGEPAAEAPTDEMATAVVKSAGVSIQYPKRWLVTDLPTNPTGYRQYLREYPALADFIGIDPDASVSELKKVFARFRQKVRFFAIDVSGDRDNVIVNVEHGEWWTGLEEFRAGAKLAAKTTGAKLLFATETRVGKHQAFKSLEQDKPEDGANIFGYMEIREDDRTSFSISLTVDGESRDIAEAILDSVSPAA